MTNDSTEARWHEASVMTEIKRCRSGWRGAWDAIKAAWSGDNRLTVSETVRLSVFIKTDSPERLTFDAKQGDRPLRMHAAQVSRYGDLDLFGISPDARIRDDPPTRFIQTTNTRAEAQRLGGHDPESHQDGEVWDEG
jgi:hypothetical protein